MNTADYWIQHLKLDPHPEGGFFREIYRSHMEADNKNLPHGYQGTRRFSTSIYYLLRSGDISRFHRLRSDELWYFHYGSPVKIVLIDQEGKRYSKLLGPRPDRAEQPQVIIPAGTIFGAEITESNSFGLYGCMVTPGFEYDDFEIFSKEDLIQSFPNHADIIEKFG